MKLTSPPIEVGGQGRKTSITHFSTKRNTNEPLIPTFPCKKARKAFLDGTTFRGYNWSNETTRKEQFYAGKKDRARPGQLRGLRGLPRHGAHRGGAVLPADLLVRGAELPRGRLLPPPAGGGAGQGAGLLAGPHLQSRALDDHEPGRGGGRGPRGVPEPHRRGLRRLPRKGRGRPGAGAPPPPLFALPLHPKVPRRHPRPGRELAGGGAAAAGRGVPAGGRRRHRKGHLAGPAGGLRHGGKDLRLLPPAPPDRPAGCSSSPGRTTPPRCSKPA